MAKKVTVYSTPTCPFCVRAKKFLNDSGIAFTDIDVSSDHDKAQEMIKVSGQMGVPVIIIDGEITVGFDKDRLKTLLGI